MLPYASVRERAGRRPAPGRRAGARRQRRIWQLVAVLLLPLVMSACVPSGISAKSNDVHRLFYVILWLALPVFLFVEGMLLISIIRYRKRRGDDSAPPQNPGTNTALALFFAGPLVIVILLLVTGEITVAKVDRNSHPSERVVVTGFQWEWSSNYVNEAFTVTGKTLKQPMLMELPVDTPTRIELRSNDVIHEFFVPHLLLMKNAVPGHPNVITVTPTKVGTYPSRCAQFCGLWHSQMTFTVKVVPQADFRTWVDKQKKAGPGGGGACQPSGSTLSLVAHQISWDKNCLAVTAGKPFQITINNQDAGIAHNFAIWDSPAMKHQFYVTPDITGPATKTFTIRALPPGKYYFQCDIHGPAMAGTFIVG